MGFRQLAQLYNPNIKPECASNSLRIWINKSDELLGQLKRFGYKKYAKLLTPKQVQVIVEHLGPP